MCLDISEYNCVQIVVSVSVSGYQWWVQILVRVSLSRYQWVQLCTVSGECWRVPMPVMWTDTGECQCVQIPMSTVVYRYWWVSPWAESINPNTSHWDVSVFCQLRYTKEDQSLWHHWVCQTWCFTESQWDGSVFCQLRYATEDQILWQHWLSKWVQLNHDASHETYLSFLSAEVRHRGPDTVAALAKALGAGQGHVNYVSKTAEGAGKEIRLLVLQQGWWLNCACMQD